MTKRRAYLAHPPYGFLGCGGVHVAPGRGVNYRRNQFIVTEVPLLYFVFLANDEPGKKGNRNLTLKLVWSMSKALPVHVQHEPRSTLLLALGDLSEIQNV